ncbi:unnamed protein product [Paramecium sonneborni]|uniref:Uncharacterized protein n=1 Tax=Paramecium sonneborni TaxID=65129 RepID=A0A8S1RVW6_9CILI|nr:unnamed protein product [Paramecium sonneborni]
MKKISLVLNNTTFQQFQFCLIQIKLENGDSFANNAQHMENMIDKCQDYRKLLNQFNNNRQRSSNQYKEQLINLLKQFKIQKLKSKVFEQFEELINLINDWISVLQEKEAIYSKFSFYKELENLLSNPKEKIQQLEQEIQIVNYCYNYKVFNKIKYFNQFQECESYFQHLKILEQDNQQSNQDLQNLEQQILKQSKIKLKQKIQKQEGEINFNLIDQSVDVMQLLLILLGQL